MKFLNLKSGIYTGLVGLMVAVFLTSSCIKERIDFNNISDSINLSPRFSAPIAYSDITLKDILEKQDTSGIILQYADGLFYLLYSEPILSKTAEEIVSIPDQSYTKSITAGDIPSFGGNPSISFTDTTTYNFSLNNGEEIDSVLIKGGVMQFNVTSTFHHTGTITITIPTLTLNGQPFSTMVNINKLDGTFATLTPPVSLAGYKLILKNNGVVYNQIPIRYDIILQNSSQPIIAGQSIDITTDVNQFMFKTIFGYINNYQLLNISDNVKMDIFDNNSSSNLDIDFADPRINLYLTNSFGVPSNIDFSNTYTESSDGTTFNITFSGNPFDIKYPQYPNLDEIVNDTLKFNKTNTNFFDAIPTKPKYFYYTLKSTANPNGKGSYNFINDTSKIAATMEVELPFDMSIGSYEINDTMDFSFSDSAKFDLIKELHLIADFENHVPFNLNAQVYICSDDECKIFIDSLFTASQQPIIRINSSDIVNGRVTQSTPSHFSIDIAQSKIPEYKKTKKMLIKSNISTPGNGSQYVKFYATDKVHVNIGAKVQFSIGSFNDL